MKKFGILVLIIIASLIIIKIGPVWPHRLFGYTTTDKIFYTYWIDNEEYCYLRVRSYFTAVSIWPTPFQMVDGLLRGPNATFYIYKVNINQPDKKKLIRKITEKVSFDIPEVWKKIRGEEFTFRRLDNGELVLLIRGRLKYIAYYMNTNGKLLKKRIFDYNYIDGNSVFNISPDGIYLLLNDIDRGLYKKNINTNKKELFEYGLVKLILKDKFIDYDVIYIEDKNRKIKDPTKVKYEIYLIDDNKKNTELVCTKDYLKYNEYDKNYKELPSFLDAAFYPEQNLIFLSKIGIFKKEGEKWQEIKDLKDMEFNLYHPDWSPDGKRLVGAIDNKTIKVIEVKDLLKK